MILFSSVIVLNLFTLTLHAKPTNRVVVGVVENFLRFMLVNFSKVIGHHSGNGKPPTVALISSLRSLCSKKESFWP